MITGTSHFVSWQSADSYYKEMGYSAADVTQKVAEGEIHIGPPKLKKGETLGTTDNGRRYTIRSN
jgi:hypothetical protein